MPTPAGKPKVNEQIRWIHEGHPDQIGLVLQRTAGVSWSIKVRWETGPQAGQTKWITEAQYWVDQGNLRVITISVDT